MFDDLRFADYELQSDGLMFDDYSFAVCRLETCIVELKGCEEKEKVIKSILIYLIHDGLKLDDYSFAVCRLENCIVGLKGCEEREKIIKSTLTYLIQTFFFFVIPHRYVSFFI